MISRRSATVRLDIAINKLFPGEKLQQSDKRWAQYTCSFRPMTLTVDRLIDHVLQGHSFCPVMKDSYRKQDNFLSAQHIGLDDDRGIPESSIDALVEDPFIADHASFLYETISSTKEHPKSRIVFILDTPITDKRRYRLVQEALWWKFSATDPHVKEESRFFYGSPRARVIKLGSILYGDILQEQVVEPFLLAKQTKANGHNVAQPVGAIIAEGHRNNALTSLAGTMRRRGMSEDAIAAALLVENDTKCVPKLPESEVRNIAISVCRYPPSEENRIKGDRQSGTELGNLSSDLEIVSSEVRLRRVSAAGLQLRALEGRIPPLEKLPFLGQSECSPIIRGWSHMLSGYPKTGKTELLARIASELSGAGLRVLYLTEEPENVWAVRLAGLPPGFGNVDLAFALGLKAEDLMSAIANGQDNVVILDTIRLLGITDENDNSKVNLALTPFIAQCRYGCKTLILAHHNRKGGGEYGQAAPVDMPFWA